MPQFLKFKGFPGLSDVVELPGMFAHLGPDLVAFVVVWRQEGRQVLRALWQRGWQLNFEKIWLLPALLLSPLTALLTTLILVVLQGSFSWEYSLPGAMNLRVFLLIFFECASRGIWLVRMCARALAKKDERASCKFNPVVYSGAVVPALVLYRRNDSGGDPVVPVFSANNRAFHFLYLITQ